MTDGIKDKYRHELMAIFVKYSAVDKVVLFGSRAMGSFSTTSDIDFALYGETLTMQYIADIAFEIENLTIPQRVDLIVHHTIQNQNLLAHIEQHGVLFYQAVK